MKGEGISLNKQNILFSICCNQKEAFQRVCVYESECVSVYVCFKVRIGFLSSWSVDNGHQV